MNEGLATLPEHDVTDTFNDPLVHRPSAWFVFGLLVWTGLPEEASNDAKAIITNLFEDAASDELEVILSEELLAYPNEVFISLYFRFRPLMPDGFENYVDDLWCEIFEGNAYAGKESIIPAV